MRIFVDIDNTICDTIGTQYVNATPRLDKITVVNKLFNDGHYIVYWTARGTVSGIDFTELTTNQLNSWGVKYHEIRLKKPTYDIFVDDKALTNIDQLKDLFNL
jgi:hypothetical protein